MSIKIVALPIVHRNADRIYADSRDVAEYFGKRPADVLRAANSLRDDESEAFWQRNFALRDGENKRGKPQQFCEMTKDGFALLVMGFTGKGARKFKIAYITQFNKMEAELKRLYKMRSEPGWLESRDIIKITFPKMCACLDMMRHMSGKETSGHHYSNEAKAVIEVVTGSRAACQYGDLTTSQLKLLNKVEHRNIQLMKQTPPCKDRRKILLDEFEDDATLLLN